MNLDTTDNILLFRNCILVEIRKLNYELSKPNSDFSTIKSNIEKCNEILKSLDDGDIEYVTDLIKHLKHTEYMSKLSDFFISNSPQDIANVYIGITKKLLIETGNYSEQKFIEFTEAFKKGIHSLNEESNDDSSDNTSRTKNYLNKIYELIRKYLPKKMNSSQFKELSEQYRDLTKSFGISKFQEYFDTKNQTINNMEISEEKKSENSQFTFPVYRTNFTLVNTNLSTEHLVLEEPASKTVPVLDYYQNFCYSYLEADKFSKIDESLIDENTISTQLNIFKDCFEKLKDMSKYKINILPNRMVRFSAEAQIEPTELELDFDNNKEHE